MIRKLNHADSEVILPFLRREPEVNLFTLADIENHGFEQPFLDLWGEFDADGEVQAVLLRYHDTLIFYAPGEYDLAAWAQLIRSQKAFMLMGPTDTIEVVGTVVGLEQQRETHLCRLRSTETLPDLPRRPRVELATQRDIDALLAIYNSMDEFMRASREEMQQALAEGTSRVYVIRRLGRIVSVARTAAENSSSAMVIGVATVPRWRHKGYATACMTRLCHDMLAQGRSLCLFYDNPEAGRIYQRIGFEDIGKWRILTRP